MNYQTFSEPETNHHIWQNKQANNAQITRLWYLRIYSIFPLESEQNNELTLRLLFKHLMQEN